MRHKIAFAMIFSLAIVTSFFLSAEAKEQPGVADPSRLSDSGTGQFRALLIGINDYQDASIQKLKTAVADAKAVGEMLSGSYNFMNPIQLLDQQATRKAIDQAFRKMIEELTTADSLFIYFAGHGDLDRLTKDGWWVPYDATAGDPTTYIDNSVIQKYIGAMKARHVLLVSDSCYSGTLLGETRALPPVIDDQFYRELYESKSRWGMTSGNRTPVTDAGSEGHSLFAYHFLKTLKNSDKSYLTPREMYAKIGPVVRNNSEQMPVCLPIRNTGDEGGEFVFVRASLGDSAGSGVGTTAKLQTLPDQPPRVPGVRPAADSLSFQVNYVYRPGGSGELKPISNGAILHSGDHYKIIFKPDQNCYIYIYQVDSAGQIFQLFPMSEFKGVKVSNENPVAKGINHVVPAPDKSFRLDKQVGKERIYLIASKEPNAELEGLYRTLQTARQQRNMQQANAVQEKLSKHFKRRGVDEIVTDRKIGVRWEESEDVFSVINTRLENLCRDCVHVVEFVHE
jgi:hypothetical protein